MRKILLALLAFPVLTFGQFRVVSNASFVTVNDSTYTASITAKPDLTGFGYTAFDIEVGDVVFTAVENAYKIDSVWGKTRTSANIRVQDYNILGDSMTNQTYGKPMGQFVVARLNPNRTIPQAPIAVLAASPQLNSAIDAHNAKVAVTVTSQIEDSTRINATGDSLYYYQNDSLIGVAAIKAGLWDESLRDIGTIYYDNPVAIGTDSAFSDVDLVVYDSSGIGFLQIVSGGGTAYFRLTDGLDSWDIRNVQGSGDVFRISRSTAGDAQGGFLIDTLNRVGINVNTIDFVTSDADLYIDKTSGVLLSRGTTLQRPTTTDNGLLRFNTDSTRYEYWDNVASAWVQLLDTSGINYSLNWTNDTLYLTDNVSTLLTRIVAPWEHINNYIYTTTDSVGIGTSSPLAALDVRGRIDLFSPSSSTYIGRYAGNDMISTNQKFNVGIGIGSMQFDTIGKYNTGIGGYTLQNYNGIENAYNTAIGYGVLDAVGLTGVWNTGVGANSLGATTTGQGNTVIGFNSLASNISGSNNTVVGAQSYAGNTGGDNTIVGYGINNGATGSSNTAIGYNADLLGASATNQIVIGSNVQSIGDNTAIIGNGITKLKVNNYTFNTDQSLTGVDGYVLTYDSITAEITLKASTGGGGGDTDDQTLSIVGKDSIAISEGNQVRLPIYYNVDEGTYQADLDWNQQLLLGQENLYRVKNSTGSLIPAGTLVGFAGTTGASGQILVSPFNANGTVPGRYIVGVTPEDIANDTTGYVTTWGKIRGIATDSNLVGTEAWSNGDILWADPNNIGGLTKTEPQGPNLKIPIAAVVYSAANNGEIIVRVETGESLYDDRDVQIDTANITDNQLLVWDDGQQRWENGYVKVDSITVFGEGTTADPLYVDTFKLVTIDYLNTLLDTSITVTSADTVKRKIENTLIGKGVESNWFNIDSETDSCNLDYIDFYVYQRSNTIDLGPYQFKLYYSNNVTHPDSNMLITTFDAYNDSTVRVDLGDYTLYKPTVLYLETPFVGSMKLFNTLIADYTFVCNTGITNPVVFTGGEAKDTIVASGFIVAGAFRVSTDQTSTISTQDSLKIGAPSVSISEVPSEALDVIGKMRLAVNEGGGDFSVYIGNLAGKNHNDAASNNSVGVGWRALEDFNSGAGNTAIGAATLANLTTGSFNTALGWLAGLDLQGGSNNILIGTRMPFAGVLTDAYKSIYIGDSIVASSETPIEEIVIGSKITGAGNNTVTIGNSSNTKLKSNKYIFNVDQSTTGLDGYVLTFNESSGEIELQESTGGIASVLVDSLTIFGDGTIGKELRVDTVTKIATKVDLLIKLDSTAQFSGDVTGTFDNISVTDDSHNHIISNIDGLQDSLYNKVNVTDLSPLTLYQQVFTANGTDANYKFTETSISDTVDNIIVLQNGLTIDDSYISILSPDTIQLSYIPEINDRIVVIVFKGIGVGGGGGIASVLVDSLTIFGDGTSGNELRVDTITKMATKVDLLGYVTTSTTQSISGEKTFTNDNTILSTNSAAGFPKLTINNTQSGSSLANYFPSIEFKSISDQNAGVKDTIARIVALGSGDGSTYPHSASIEFLGTTLTSNRVGADILFKTNYTTSGSNSVNTERMRITSAGNVGIGTTSPSTPLHVRNSVSIISVEGLTNADGNFHGIQIEAGSRKAHLGVYDHAGIASNAALLLLEEQDGTDMYYWTDNSDNLRYSTDINNIGTTNGSVVGDQSSDIRIKNDLGKFNYGINTIMQLNPVKFSYKNDENNKPHIGFYAQDVIGIVPEAVNDTKEIINEGEPTKLSMSYVSLIPILTKAIQEQQEIIEQLKARIEALENK